MALQQLAPQNKNNGSSPQPDDIRSLRMAELADDAPSDASLDLNAPVQPRGRFQLSRNVLLGGLFAIGLALTSLTLGWSLASLNQPALAPWQSSPAYERMYVTWVAERYAQTGNAAQAQRDLAGPRREYVADLLTSLQRETAERDAQKRQRLAALAEVLRPPPSETSFVPTLFAQPVFVSSLALSLAPLLAALALIALPYVQSLRQSRARETQEPIAIETSTDALEELLADVKIEDPTAPLVETQKDQAAAQTEAEQKPEEEEKQADQDGGLGDLASLFEEEDTSLAALEAFCKGLADINLDALLANARGVVRSFKDGIARRA